MTINKNKLIKAAREAASASYSPYSNFRVGAALLCRDKTVYTGTNIENRSYGLTICAERSAFFTAISAGKRDFSAIAIFSPDSETPLPPCGACRQVISEFVADNFPVIMIGKNNILEKIITELLPLDSLHDLKA